MLKVLLIAMGLSLLSIVNKSKYLEIIHTTTGSGIKNSIRANPLIISHNYSVPISTIFVKNHADFSSRASANWPQVNTYDPLNHYSNSLNLHFKSTKRNNYISNPYNVPATSATLEQFGAKGNGITDDTQAIRKALNSKIPIIYARKTKAYYKVSELIVVSNVHKKKLMATGATILNSDLTKATFLFQDADNINITGGTYGYVSMPVTNGGNSQHVFQFNRCQKVVVSKIHITNSPEMGIATTNSNYVTIQNSVIEHTFRDGTYAHYSSNVKYMNNVYKNIKDDAMSFHDYGVVNEKKELINYGYQQASNLTVQGNRVENAYQGFGSIGAKNIHILKNKFKNTVLAGIAVFNSTDLTPTGNAYAADAEIVANVIDSPCSTVSINGKPYTNNGQASTGRAGIYVGSLGANNQMNNGESKRLKNITVTRNKVYNSSASGFVGTYIDNLQFMVNEFINCSGAVPSLSLSGDVIEMYNVTNLVATNNSILDNRAKVLHQHAYTLNKVSGKMSGWNVKGVVAGEKHVVESTALQSVPEPVKTKKVIKR